MMTTKSGVVVLRGRTPTQITQHGIRSELCLGPWRVSYTMSLSNERRQTWDRAVTVEIVGRPTPAGPYSQFHDKTPRLFQLLEVP